MVRVKVILVAIMLTSVFLMGCALEGEKGVAGPEDNDTIMLQRSVAEAESFIQSLAQYRKFGGRDLKQESYERLDTCRHCYSFAYSFRLNSEKDPSVIDKARIVLTLSEGSIVDAYYAQGMVSDRKIVVDDVERCKTVRFFCEQGYEEYNDETGCGCQAVEIREKYFCMQSERDLSTCKAENETVCGWFDPDMITCVKSPCAQTFLSRCEACSDGRVGSWSEGECPGG